MRFTHRFLVLIIAWFGVGQLQVHAQFPNISFDHITIDEGLSQSTVFAITQDAQGFMWFGTRDGLNRYDARKIKIFRHDPDDPNSISDNTVYSLLTDSKNRTWVGTRHGLNLYDVKNDNFIHNFLYTNASGANTYNTVNCLYEDRAKNIWIGTRDGLNLLVEGDTLRLHRFQHDPQLSNSLGDNDVRSIFQDKNGTMWIGTSNNLCRFDFRNESEYTFSTFNVPGSNNQYPKTNWVNTISQGNNGLLLIGTEKTGLVFFDPEKLTFINAGSHTVDSKAVRTIVKDPRQNIWVGTIGGVFILNEEFGFVKKLTNSPENSSSISDNSIRSIYFDRAGSSWVGGFHGGVNFYSPLSNRFNNIRPGPEFPELKFKVASALAVDTQQNMWIGTEGDGVYYLDRKNKITHHFHKENGNKNSLSHDNVKCFLLEEGKGIWIGTIKGLNYYDFKHKTFTHYFNNQNDPMLLSDDAIYDIIKDHNGDFWIATFRGGLIKFSPRTGKLSESFMPRPEDPSSISSEGLTRLKLDSKNTLWVGTLSGLNKRENGNEQFVRYMPNVNDSGSFKGDYILCLFEDSDKRLWIGTRGNGLNLLRQNGESFRHFTTAHGLPGNSIYGIQEDNNKYLWLSTDNGLSRLDKRTILFKNFGRNDGLICKEYNYNSYEKDHLGNLYFGGYNGVVYFHPDSIQENNVVPSLVFTELKLFNAETKHSRGRDVVEKQDFASENEVELKYDQNIFSVEFAVLSYVKAAKNQFAYRLDGFETEWNIVKEPVAMYMNLKPGTYTLLAKGANNDGFWNEEPISLTIKVLPPPWKTWWAYTLYFAIFFALLYTWSRFKEKQVELEHELEIEHLEKQKQDELHHAKLNFFTNIAHEIRTPLTLMIGPVDHIHETLRQNNSLKKDIGLVKKNTDKLMRLLNQLLDFQKQETGNVKLKVRKGNFMDFISEIVLPFEEFSNSRNVRLNVSMPDQAIFLWFDYDELTKVFNNLLVNAFKFTPGGGQVWVKISKESTAPIDNQNFTLKITIEDNGLGISANQLEKIFHRFYQAENTGVHETGFGIGLALAKGIIELHHGEISVESQEATAEQHGYTRFHIILPGGNAHFVNEEVLLEEVSNQVEIQTVPDDPLEATCDEKHNHNDRFLILVVEDNDDIREYIGDTLSQYHYDVITACNGQEGWKSATERLPDLVLSDVMMGGMNGLDLVTQVKRDVRTSHIPIILLTARASVNHQVEGLITGADDYLTKPFNVQLLLAKIGSHLSIREKLREKYCRMVTLQPPDEIIEGPDDKFLKRLMEVLEANLLDTDFNVSKLSREIGMSRPVLFRKTKMLTGLSVIDLIRSVRLKKAEMLLKQRKLSISEVAFAVGFNDPKYFSKSFKEQYGKSPSHFMED